MLKRIRTPEHDHSDAGLNNNTMGQGTAQHLKDQGLASCVSLVMLVLCHWPFWCRSVMGTGIFEEKTYGS